MTAATPTTTTLLKRSAVVWDHAAQMRAALDQDTLNEYTLAFSAYNGWGEFPPVTVFHDGANYWGADGFHRRAAFDAFCAAAGKELPIPAAVLEGDLRAAILHAAQANSRHGLRRSNADKRRSVEALLADPEWAAWSNRRIAAQCHVSDKLVADVRAALDAAPSARTVTRTVNGEPQTYTMATAAIGARPVATDKPAAVAQSLTYNLPGHLRHGFWMAWQEGDTFHARHPRHGAAQAGDWNELIEQVETLLAGTGAPSAPQDTPTSSQVPGNAETTPITLGAPVPAPVAAPGLAVGKCRVCGRPLTDPAHVAAGIGPCCAARLNGGSGDGADADESAPLLPVSERPGYDSDEWYTPQWLIDEVRAFFGGAIALDPASCALAQSVVQAAAYFSKEDDGLAGDWHAESVFLNMPYSNPRPWVEKAVAEHKAGRARRLVLLVNNATETDWFQSLLRDYPVCFLAKRLAYWRHDHSDVGARQGQALFFLGDDNWRYQFTRRFASHGVVLTRSR